MLAGTRECSNRAEKVALNIIIIIVSCQKRNGKEPGWMELVGSHFQTPPGISITIRILSVTYSMMALELEKERMR